ncbi:Cif family virulence factor [Actinokineospora iranica]|uniref:SnoaL-like domain-containing protein n=1 Tax=Actinokineospora iranica TaxID=1271860 RepID=A0A1G6QDX8_9PSEU|nr:nuclear transport factor 2 family protein [Actinokineospora iranica]SDC90589.1 hypothetical protein SAMN05216174_105238 [Actinokineospora iranica]
MTAGDGDCPIGPTGEDLPGDQPISEVAVRGLVRDWFAALDRHDDVAVLLELLTTAGLAMHLPRRTVRSHEDFAAWYDETIASFFDEDHDVVEVKVTPTSPWHAEVELRVDWQCRMWRPPSANSVWVGVTVTEHWSVVMQGGRPKIRTCTVGGSAPMPGSAVPPATGPRPESAAA